MDEGDGRAEEGKDRSGQPQGEEIHDSNMDDFCTPRPHCQASNLSGGWPIFGSPGKVRTRERNLGYS